MSTFLEIAEIRKHQIFQIYRKNAIFRKNAILCTFLRFSEKCRKMSKNVQKRDFGTPGKKGSEILYGISKTGFSRCQKKNAKKREKHKKTSNKVWAAVFFFSIPHTVATEKKSVIPRNCVEEFQKLREIYIS